VTSSEEMLKSAARLKYALEPLHAMVYFVPEGAEIYGAAGLKPGRMTYFASRAAAFGAVGAGAVAATFYNFNPTLVAKFLPDAWQRATPQVVTAARYEVVDAALTRLLGPGTVASAELAEAVELTKAAVADLNPDGRPLYAAHADLPWPDAAPHVVLWHAITLFREWRGDAHVAALVGHELDGLQALITHTATGRGFTEATAKLTRGWSDEQWDAASDGLRQRELLDAQGALSGSGSRLRAQIEYQTDRTSLTPVLTLGEERTTRLVELGRALSRQVVEGGAFPAGTFA
jgi:hypothetical protein